VVANEKSAKELLHSPRA